MTDDTALPITPEERDALFAPLSHLPLALCVSGGPDSMALMHLVSEWAAAGRQNAGHPISHARSSDRLKSATGLSDGPIWLSGVETEADLAARNGLPPIVVLTIDHGLRPEGGHETRFVADEAVKLGLPCQILTVDEPLPTTGIQEWARGLRHRLLLGLLDDERRRLSEIGWRCLPFERTLVMAHHQDDQAETVLMRLARGSGLEGLGGMRPSDEIVVPATSLRPRALRAAVVRPLLDMPKARLKATLNARGARWVEDTNNESDRFERVRVRKALAVLADVGLTAEKIALSARRLRDADADLEAIGWPTPSGDDPFVDWRGGLCADVRLSWPLVDSDYRWPRALSRILRAMGGGARPATLAQIEELARSTRHRSRSGGGKGLTLGGCKIEFSGDGEIMRVFREGAGESLPEVEIPARCDVDWDGGRFRISGRHAPRPAVVGALGAMGWARLKREVPALENSGFPAAAAATLPVIGRDGVLIAYPGIDGACRCSRVAATVREAWGKWASGLEEGQSWTSHFTGAPLKW